MCVSLRISALNVRIPANLSPFSQGDLVYFGVGSYGSDPSRAGLCYRIKTQEIERDLLVQVITAGGDGAGSFTLMMADGGFNDSYTACAGSLKQFMGSKASWGGPKGYALLSGVDYALHTGPFVLYYALLSGMHYLAGYSTFISHNFVCYVLFYALLLGYFYIFETYFEFFICRAGVGPTYRDATSSRLIPFVRPAKWTIFNSCAAILS